MKAHFTWKYQDIKFAGIEWKAADPHKIIVLVHGIGEHIERYDNLAKYFNQYSYHVIGLDHYGHGTSDGQKGASKGFSFYFEYLQAFLDYIHQQHNKPIILYGHSMGGGIVTGFILKYKSSIQAAVITSPALLTYRKVPRYLLMILAVLNKLIPNMRIKQGLNLQKISHDHQVIEAFKKDPLNHNKMSIRLAYSMLINGLWCIEHAQQLKIPTLLIHGDADEFTSVEGSRLFADKAQKNLLTYKEWGGGFHELHNEPNKMEVLAFILSWLNKV
ncbi:alpha/beta hydrolase [Olivibacter domesticus]|uniref:Lysophospholipase, alpha-beta hydrolase superfamily n=1 Tax=Olivibacter domesticus TaxID=407022 RepID=A0A1H7QTA8_OLID1|nr:alpha/beta hydrolase [Olivibacter domesticus]SEL51163.1 Lysophospholipase, alpha-beta hydrolase superfamily [Olivibacter domesticus]